MGFFLVSLKYSAHGHNNSRKSMLALTTFADENAFNLAENLSEIKVERILATSSNVHFFTTGASSYIEEGAYTNSGRGSPTSTVGWFNAQVLDSSQVSMFGVSEMIPSTVVLQNLLRRLVPEIVGLAVALVLTIGLFIYALPHYGSASWGLGFTIAGNLLALLFVLFLGSKKVRS